MTPSLLPDDFDERVRQTTRTFWAGRSSDVPERELLLLPQSLVSKGVSG